MYYYYNGRGILADRKWQMEKKIKNDNNATASTYNSRIPLHGDFFLIILFLLLDLLQTHYTHTRPYYKLYYKC